MENLFDVSGKTILVTGGATGIGSMIVEGLVRAGCRILIASRKEAVLSEFSTKMNEIVGGSVSYCVADLATVDGMDRLEVAARDFSDSLDVLINNSGVSWGAKLTEFPIQGWEKVMGLNVTAVFELTRRLLPLLEKSAAAGEPARIINIGSIMGTKASEFSNNGLGTYSYSASKAAVHHLTKCLSNELVPKNICVNAIAPGPFRSRMMATTVDSDEKLQDLIDSVPIGRMGSPEDITGTVRWLSSRAGAFISGAIIPVDGGMSAAS